MTEILVVIGAVTVLGVTGLMVWDPGPWTRRAMLCALALGGALWIGHHVQTSTNVQQRQITNLERDRDNLCSRVGHRLNLDLQDPLREDDERACDMRSWCGEQLRGYGTIRVIGPLLRYCVRDAASCAPIIDALLGAQRPETAFSTAPAYRANLAVLAAAFEGREGCRP